MVGDVMVRARLSRFAPGARVALFGALVVVVDDVAYLRLIADQNTGFAARVAFVASLLAIIAVAITAGIGKRSAALLGFATATSVALGVVAMFSIGLPLVVAGGMCSYALAKLMREAHVTAAAGMLAGVAVVVGFLLIPR